MRLIFSFKQNDISCNNIVDLIFLMVRYRLGYDGIYHFIPIKSKEKHWHIVVQNIVLQEIWHFICSWRQVWKLTHQQDCMREWWRTNVVAPPHAEVRWEILYKNISPTFLILFGFFWAYPPIYYKEERFIEKENDNNSMMSKLWSPSVTLIHSSFVNKFCFFLIR